MIRAGNWQSDLAEFLDCYRYQPDLTRRLDVLGSAPFDQTIINEIVLWKVNRYAPLAPEALSALAGANRFPAAHHRDAEEVVAILLHQPGVDLPMASTFLRFRNSQTFQIIDRHAYRAVTGDDYPLYSTSKDKDKINLYFDYLDQLIELAKLKNLQFESLDRLLYVFDKQKNGPLRAAPK
jgi:hypothetical protein